MKVLGIVALIKALSIVALLLVVGCSTTDTRVASVCDTQMTKFWFIPLTKNETCIGASSGTSESEIPSRPE